VRSTKDTLTETELGFGVENRQNRDFLGGFLMLGTKRVCRRQVLLGIILLFVVGFSTYGKSQISASLSGSVVDPSGQPVNNAKVVLASQGKGLSRTFTTSDNGLYTFTLLPQDTYNLDIEAPGFKHLHQ